MTYIVTSRYMSCQFYNKHKKSQTYECCPDICLVCTDICRYNTNKNDTLGKMTGHISVWLDIYRDNHDICRVFASCACFRHISRLFLSNWIYGCSHEQVTDICHHEWLLIYPPWHDIGAGIFMKKAKWQRIWVPTTTYEQPSAKKHAKMENGCSHVVVGTHMPRHFAFFMKNACSYVVDLALSLDLSLDLHLPGRCVWCPFSCPYLCS